MTRPTHIAWVSVLIPALCLAAEYDEAASGDLSNDRLAPTLIDLTDQSNPISGTVILGDRDYFAAHVPAGMALSAIVLEAYDSANGRAFLGVQSGAAFTADPENASPSELLGYTHFGFDTVIGGDLLDDIADAPGAIGAIVPLTPGYYSFWLNQTEPALTGYRLNRMTVSNPVTPGDTNRDNKVEITDLGALATHWQQPGTWAMGDFDGSGFVEISDLGLLATNWQAGAAPPGLVPEPSTLTAAALLVSLQSRRPRG